MTRTKGGLSNKDKMTRAQKRNELKDLNACSELYQIIKHFFPDLIPLLSQVKDPRCQNYITYESKIILLFKILAGAFHIGSMRKMTEEFNSEKCIKNMGYVLNEEELAELPHWKTVNDYLERLAPSELQAVIQELVYHLTRMRSFEDSRTRGKYWQIIIDGTYLYDSNKRHCPNCLVKNHKDKNENILWTEYYHCALEAKLVLNGNMVISIATEFIENENEDVSKQDCELNAFYRLAEKLKKAFPRLPICLTMDSLYAAGPVFDVCKKNDWRYIIRFKDGSIPSIAEEFQALKNFLPQQTHFETKDGITKTYSYITDISYQSHIVNVVEYTESGLPYPFVFITDLSVSKRNCESTVQDGRRRWKIENKGFNDQKNQGFELKHLFSEDYNAMKNHYLLIQIAHMITQFVENGLEIWQLIKAPSYMVSQMLKQSFQTFVLNDALIETFNPRRKYRFI